MEEKLKNLLRAVKTTAVAAGHAAGRAAEATSKKAGEVVEQTKLSLRIIDLEGGINDHYREIGRLVYASKDETVIETSTIEEQILKIDEKREEIDQLRSKIESLKRSANAQIPTAASAATETTSSALLAEQCE